jgi:hypothetical protein
MDVKDVKYGRLPPATKMGWRGRMPTIRMQFQLF